MQTVPLQQFAFPYMPLHVYLAVREGLPAVTPCWGEPKEKHSRHCVPHFYWPSLIQASLTYAGQNKKCPACGGAMFFFCGEGGIRTLDTSLGTYDGLANR
jgi:hypothetical protein